MMKNILVTIIICCVNAITWGQVEVGVRTDKSTYYYGDTVSITVTAFNPTADTVVLRFGSSCQANYIIDDFNFLDHVSCLAVLTSRTIPPYNSISWDYFKYPTRNTGWPLLLPGAHNLIGEVIGYARSDTLAVFVTPLTPVSAGYTKLNSFFLDQNYPNPFNPATTIRYSIPKESFVTLKIYDVLGRELETLVDEEKTAGIYETKWSATGYQSGLYFYRLRAGPFSETKKLLLLK